MLELKADGTKEIPGFKIVMYLLKSKLLIAFNYFWQIIVSFCNVTER